MNGWVGSHSLAQREPPWCANAQNRRRGDLHHPRSGRAFQLISIGDAFAYKTPGAAAYVWAAEGRSFLRVHLLGAVDLDGNGVPEVVFGQQHQEGMMVFGVIELGTRPRVVGSYGEVAY